MGWWAGWILERVVEKIVVESWISWMVLGAWMVMKLVMIVMMDMVLSVLGVIWNPLHGRAMSQTR